MASLSVYVHEVAALFILIIQNPGSIMKKYTETFKLWQGNKSKGV